MTTHIRITKATVKKIALGEGVVEITLKAMAADVDASREDLDEASSPTFLADVDIDGETQQLDLGSAAAAAARELTKAGVTITRGGKDA